MTIVVRHALTRPPVKYVSIILVTTSSDGRLAIDLHERIYEVGGQQVAKQ